MIRPILIWPDPKLRAVSKPVLEADFGSYALRGIVQDLFDTLAASKGVGLAAIQVGIPYRIFVMSMLDSEPQVFINPVIMKTLGEPSLVSEGCLSLPGIYEDVERYEEVIMSAFDIAGVEALYQLSDEEAQCALHECEHLDGRMIPDSFGRVKKDIIKRKIAKYLRNRR